MDKLSARVSRQQVLCQVWSNMIQFSKKHTPSIHLHGRRLKQVSSGQLKSRGGVRRALPFKNTKPWTPLLTPAALSPFLGSSRQNISQMTRDNPHGFAGILFKAPPAPSSGLANRWQRVDPACLDLADPSYPAPFCLVVHIISEVAGSLSVTHYIWLRSKKQKQKKNSQI